MLGNTCGKIALIFSEVTCFHNPLEPKIIQRLEFKRDTSLQRGTAITCPSFGSMQRDEQVFPENVLKLP